MSEPRTAEDITRRLADAALSGFSTSYETAVERVRGVVREIQAQARREAVEALRPWTKHRSVCCSDIPCTCGLDAALARLAGEGGER